MHSLIPEDLAALRFDDTHAATLRSLGEQQLYAARSPEALKVLQQIAMIDFLYIHSFSNGNGRTPSLLTLLLLYRCDYAVGGHIGLGRIFEDTREGYKRWILK